MLKEIILTTKTTKNQVAVFYLGQEGILLNYQDIHILIDPYLSDYVDRNCSSGGVVWKRNYGAPVEACELDFIDYIFCSHGHFDHADPDTLSVLNKANPRAKLIVPYGLKDSLVSYGISASQILCLDGDETISLGSIKATAIPAAHEDFHLDADGHYKELGYQIQLGDLKIFHAGDCCVYDGLLERIRGVDIGFLPINGRDYYRLKEDIIGNMDSREAVLLAKEAQIKLLVPLHFDLYQVNEVNPAYFVDCLFRINRGQRFHIFVPGEKYLYEA